MMLRPTRTKPDTGVVTRNYRQHPRYRGCIGHWLFSYGGGTKVWDISGSRFHGSLTNMDPSTDWVPGPFGGPALDFDGTNDEVDCGATPAIQSLSRITVSCWFKVSAAGRGDLVSQWGSSAWHFLLEQGLTADRLKFWVGNGGDFANSGSGDTPLNQTDWFHGVGTYDGAVVRVYVNGVEDSSNASIGQMDSVTSSTVRFSGTEDSNPHTGMIDEVRIYNRALTANEVVSLYRDPYLEFRRRPVWWNAPVVAGGLSIPVAMHNYRRRRVSA